MAQDYVGVGFADQRASFDRRLQTLWIQVASWVRKRGGRFISVCHGANKASRVNQDGDHHTPVIRVCR